MTQPIANNHPINQRQYIAVIAAQFLVFLPHLGHLPVLYSILAFISLTGLLIVAKKRQVFKPQIPRFIQYSAVLTGLAIILFTYRTLLGVDAGVAFLSLCLLGKVFELKQRRDAYIALTLALFVTAGLFLFDQSILNALLALVAILAIFYAMLQQNINPDVLNHHSSQLHANQTDAINPNNELWKPLFRLFIQAVPLLVILFIFFPRIPPLWSVPINQSQGKTGMTDEMSPGNIASLSQSTELAFRVIDPKNNLNANLPARDQLYWRGLVLSRYDGITWRPLPDYRADDRAWAGSQNRPDWFNQNIINATTGFNYQVLIEPTQQPWLFALDTPLPQTRRTALTREYNLKSSREIYQRFSYSAVQLLDVKLDIELPDWLRQANLQLPANASPRSRQLAQQVFAQVGNDPKRYVNYWLNWIRQQNFVYTLNPPVLTGQRIDQFLFESRRGFCEHYSSAYTFLMRAAGIPARVVVGYQGGQPSPDNQTWEVRQLDAHAWVEIWLAGEGWVRVDPTAAIAPERVEQGMNNLVNQNQSLFGQGALGQLRYSQFKLLGQARAWADYASFVWQQEVVGFDQSKQQGFLQRLLGINSLYAQMLWLMGSFASVFALIIGWIWWKRRKVWHPLDAPLQQLSIKLAKHGLQRREQEGVVDWLKRLQAYPKYQKPAEELTNLYQKARYAPVNAKHNEQDIVKKMKKVVTSWPNKPE